MYTKKVRAFVKKKLPKEFFENHIKYVVNEALWLCKFYPKADIKVVEISSWMHDLIHPVIDYKGNHARASAKAAKEFLKSIFYPRQNKKVYHCINAHRTSMPPEPRTIEAKIIASADNLIHFTRFYFLLKHGTKKWTKNKLKRDLEAEFMLPEALDKARKLMKVIKRKYKL